MNVGTEVAVLLSLKQTFLKALSTDLDLFIFEMSLSCQDVTFWDYKFINLSIL